MRPRVQPECKEKIYTGATGTPAGVWKFQAQKKPPTTGIGSYWERCWVRITLYRISSIDRVRTDRRTVAPCSHVATSSGEHPVRP